MTATLLKLKELALDALFPPLCLWCRKILAAEGKERNLCDTCFDCIPVRTAYTCPTCGARLANMESACHRDMPLHLAAAAPYSHEIVQRLILDLKYRRMTAAAMPLAHLIAKHLTHIRLPRESMVLVPLPLYPARKRKRGFNQSELIAELLAPKLGIAPETTALARVKNTLPQANIEHKDARARNVAGAFAVRRSEKIRSKTILLLDDVLTTGATMAEAARTLKAAGARRIIAVVAAKA